MASPQEVAAMSRALELAALGPAADPNPRVGCVVLDPGGAVLGEGRHHGAGTPHAEVEALAAAVASAGSDACRGATAVVTLEPCTHTGRTGPCARALLEAGIARVVVASRDPSALAGGGAAVLAAAGVDVETGVLADRADALNRHWLFSALAGRPFVTWKYAATLDGRSAAADGSSRWITSEAARADVHRRRAGAGAIVVGTGTVLADDPQLTVRGPDGALTGRQPLRVVVGLADLPDDARVLDDAAPTVALRTRDVHAVLAALHERGVRHVWLEGGPRLAASFVAAGLVDEALCYLAPALLGAGPSAVGDLGIATIADAVRWQLRDTARVGGDLLVVAGPLPRTQTAGTQTAAEKE